MRRTIVAGVLLASLGILALPRCSSSSGNDAGPDVGAPGEDATVAPEMDAAQEADAFMEMPDGGLTPTSCTPLTNEGCAAGVCATISIDLMGNEERACVEPGAGGDYAACGSAAECQANFSCLSLPPGSGAPMVCHQFCTASLACPGDSANPQNCVTYTATATVGFCQRVPGCDLFTQNCAIEDAGVGLGCYPVSSGAGGCLPAGTEVEGSACTNNPQCEPGLMCVQDTCRKICDPSASTDICGTLTCAQLLPHPWGTCQ